MKNQQEELIDKIKQHQKIATRIVARKNKNGMGD